MQLPAVKLVDKDQINKQLSQPTTFSMKHIIHRERTKIETKLLLYNHEKVSISVHVGLWKWIISSQLKYFSKRAVAIARASP